MQINNLTLRKKIVAKFTPKIQVPTGKSNKDVIKPILVNIERIPPPISAKFQKEVNVISKFFKSNKLASNTKQSQKSYAQVLKQNINTLEIIKIKETFLSIGTKKIDHISNIVNGNAKTKPWIQITTKGPSRKQVIIPMSNDNNSKFMKNSSVHVTNINKTLKNTKSKVLVDFIQSDPLGITVVTNKVSLQSNLKIIEHYIKNVDNINTCQVEVLCLSQSKSYLKIKGIPYFLHGNMQDCLTSNDVETIIKQNQIFNNITLTFKSQVIKASPKSDMLIIWIDIWGIQSGSRAKGLINCCFNVGKYIATIRGTNMNPGVLQCKNCWKWSHTTFLCRIQESKCVKCNSLHKSENHCEFSWCCKANEKTSPSLLETKKDKLCPYLFKCSNCWGNHQANSNLCPFWKNCFNREWH